MSVTAGALSAIQINSNNAQLSSAAATGGTGPYTYQWYKSFTTGFTPTSATLIPGATSLTLTEKQLIPATQYYYRVIATDTGAGNAIDTSTPLSVLTVAGSPVQMNQLVPTPIIGQVDQPMNPNTQSVTMDSSFGGTAYPGQAVMQMAPTGVTTSSGLNTLPHVTPCTGNTDVPMGFIQYNVKKQTFTGGDVFEISKTGNVQWQVASANGTAGTSMELDVTIPGALKPAAGTNTNCGRALDTPVIGMPFRLDISVVPHNVLA